MPIGILIALGSPYQPSEWQSIGNQIDAAMIFAGADLVNVCCEEVFAAGLYGWLRECGFVDSTRGVTGRSDIARWDLQRGPARDQPAGLERCSGDFPD